MSFRGARRSLSSGRALRGPVGANPESSNTAERLPMRAERKVIDKIVDGLKFHS